MTADYWVGSLSMAIALAVNEPDKTWAKRILRKALDEFMRSDAADAELKTMLKRELGRY